MATITSLGFSIRSSFDGSGTRAATRGLLQVQTQADRTSNSMNRTAKSTSNLVTAATLLGPALIPIAAGATAAGASLAAAGGAATIYGMTMRKAVKDTLALAKAHKALTPVQKQFVAANKEMKAAMDGLATSSMGKVLTTATIITKGLTATFRGLTPVISAVDPLVRKIAESFKGWAEGSGLKRFVAVLVNEGVPALGHLLNAGRNVLAVLGTAFRTLSPLGVGVAAAIERGSRALRSWADGGGFTKFVQYVQQVGPGVKDFFKQLAQASGKIFQAVAGLGPASLLFATGLLKIINALPLPVLQAFLLAWATYRTLLIANAGYTALFVTQLGILKGATIAETVAQWAMNAAWLASPITWIVAGIALVVTAIVLIATKTQWFQTAWRASWNGVKAVASAVWNWLKAAWNATWNYMKNIATGYYSWLKSSWGATWSWVKNFSNSVWSWMRAAWNATWNYIKNIATGYFGWLRNAWSNLWGGVKNVATTSWRAISNVLSGAWNGIKSTAKKVWSEIGNVIESAINGAIGLVNGLVGGFNKVTSFLKIDVKIPEIPKVHFATGGMVPGVQNFAGGGTVRGYSPGRDTVPAMLSPGEGVLTPEAVRGLGGPGFVHSANRTWAGHRGAGKGARAFSTGGVVDGVQKFYVGGMVQGALAKAGIGLGQVTQGEYSTSVAASAGTHSGGGVVDIAADPSNQAALVAHLRANGFAAWFRTPSEGFAYHIHAVLMNDPALSSAAKDQVTSYLHGGNGLANGGPDTGGGNPLDMLKGVIGKILANVYKGAGALASVPGASILEGLFGGGGDSGGKKQGGIGGFIKGALGTVGKVVGKVAGAIGLDGGPLGQAVLSMLSAGNIAEGFGDPKKKFGAFGMAGGIGKIVQAMGKKLVGGVIPDFLMGHKKDSTFNGLSSLAPGGGAGTDKWKTLAAMALQIVGLDGGQLGAFMSLMAHESSGNPRAINNTDSNAAAGIPSKGLMQVIDPTFKQYHVSGTSNDIYDPLANMAASANYIKHVYGGRVPGSPYASGTNNASRGWHLVGENGPELRYFRGGETVANARDTQRTLRKAGGGSTGTIEINIDARGATVEAVKHMESNLVPKLRQAVQAGVGKR